MTARHEPSLRQGAGGYIRTDPPHSTCRAVHASRALRARLARDTMVRARGEARSLPWSVNESCPGCYKFFTSAHEVLQQLSRGTR
jgi:hypothetical protein